MPSHRVEGVGAFAASGGARALLASIDEAADGLLQPLDRTRGSRPPHRHGGAGEAAFVASGA